MKQLHDVEKTKREINETHYDYVPLAYQNETLKYDFIISGKNILKVYFICGDD